MPILPIGPPINLFKAGEYVILFQVLLCAVIGIQDIPIRKGGVWEGVTVGVGVLVSIGEEDIVGVVVGVTLLVGVIVGVILTVGVTVGVFV
jgi:hypothetical protein